MKVRGETLGTIAAELEAAFTAKDASSLASLYTEDATLMPPNQEAVKGRAAIRAWYQTALAHVGTVQISPTESAAWQGEAFQVGTFAASALGESPTRLRQFKYVLILRRVGAQWQIHYDIWNGSYKSKE
jgi:uncharacterized protein (TIGR02246 family)